jgi:DNA ligase (NAD+)
MISDFKSLGINTIYLGKEEVFDNIFSDRTFVLTGTLQNFKRSELKSIIESKGGNVTGTVSKKTDVVIVGDSPGSKYSDAIKLGIEIWDEKELVKKVGGSYE